MSEPALSCTVINDTEERKKKAVRFYLQKSPIKGCLEATTLKTMDEGVKMKHCWRVQLERNGPIHLENKLKLTILRMYTSGSSGGLAVGVHRGRNHKSIEGGLCPDRWYTDSVTRQRDCVLTHKVQREMKHPSRLLSRKMMDFVLLLFYFAKNIVTHSSHLFFQHEFTEAFVLLSSLQTYLRNYRGAR